MSQWLQAKWRLQGRRFVHCSAVRWENRSSSVYSAF